MFSIKYPAVAVAGSSEQFPVHRIYCIGQNYAAHAREMGSDPERQDPVWFMKPADSVVPDGSTVDYPPRTNNLHHEIELVVALQKGGRNIRADSARELIYGYAVGLDLTRRDIQEALRKSSKPWDPAKSFEQAAPISAIHPVSDIGHPDSGRIWLNVNGKLRQEGDIADLIWSIPEALAELSTLFTLAPGDLLFTGTPSGVGPLVTGDKLSGGVEGVGELNITIGSARSA
jgi:fumarylpyruvate hydrolase